MFSDLDLTGQPPRTFTHKVHAAIDDSDDSDAVIEEIVQPGVIKRKPRMKRAKLVIHNPLPQSEPIRTTSPPPPSFKFSDYPTSEALKLLNMENGSKSLKRKETKLDTLVVEKMTGPYRLREKRARIEADDDDQSAETATGEVVKEIDLTKAIVPQSVGNYFRNLGSMFQCNVCHLCFPKTVNCQEMLSMHFFGSTCEQWYEKQKAARPPLLPTPGRKIILVDGRESISVPSDMTPMKRCSVALKDCRVVLKQWQKEFM